MNKIAYYRIYNDDGEEAMEIADKNFYDMNGCLDDNDITNTPLGQTLCSIGLEEEMESVFSTTDWSTGRRFTEQEIVSKMAEKGWTLLPFPE